jgi:hypothetical protein
MFANRDAIRGISALGTVGRGRISDHLVTSARNPGGTKGINARSDPKGWNDQNVLSGRNGSIGHLSTHVNFRKKPGSCFSVNCAKKGWL